MPMLVELQTESGQALAEADDVNDVVVTVCLSYGDSGLRLAHTIDPYGDTTFNRLQIPMLLKDLEFLLSKATAEQRPMLEEVMSLARQTLLEHHLYLKFIGD